MLRRILLVLILVLVIAPAALVGWLLFTESGLRFIAGELDRLERFGVRIEGVSGTVRGPLSIARLEIDIPRVHIVITQLEAEPLLRASVLQTAAFRWLEAEAVEVELRRIDEPAEPREDRPPRFLPHWLRVSAERVDLRDIRFATAGGVKIEAQRLRGAVELTHDQLTARDLAIESRDFTAGGAVRLESGRTLAIDVVANGRLMLEQRPEIELGAVLRGSPARLELDARLESPGDAHARATLVRSDAGWRIDAHLDSPDPALGAWIADPPVLPRDVGMDVTLTADGFRAAGELIVPQIDPAPLAIEAEGRFVERTLELTRTLIAPQSSEARLELAGRVRFAEGAPDLGLEIEWQDFAWPLAGPAVVMSTTGRASLEGGLPYRFAAEAQVAIPEQPEASVAVTGAVDAKTLELAGFRIAAAPFALAGNGRLEFEPRRWRANLEAREVDLAPWIAALPSRLDADVAVEGTGFDAAATARAHVRSLSGVLRDLPVRGSGIIGRADGGWRADQVALRIGSNTLAFDATLADRVDARWTLEIEALEGLLAGASGALRFSGSATGPRAQPSIDARWDGSALAYEGWEIERLTGSADLDLSDRTRSRIELHARGIERDATQIPELEVIASGLARAHELTVDARLSAPRAAAEPVAIELRAEGGYADRQWSGRLLDLSIDTHDEATRIALVAPTAVEASRDVAAVEPFCLKVASSNLCASVSWRRDGPWETGGTLDRLPLAALADVLPGRPDFSGSVTASFDARGRGATLLEGSAELRLVDGVVRYELVGGEKQAVELGSGVVTLFADPDRVVGEARLDASADTFIAGEVRIARNFAVPFSAQSLTGRLEARSGDTAALAFVVPELDRVAGLVEADFTIFGTVGAPRFDGYLALRDASVELYRFNTVLEDLDFVARLHARHIEIDGTSRMGEGKLEIEGQLAWLDGSPNGSIRLRGERLLVADSPEVMIVASPDLTFAVEGTSLDVTGEVLIPSARIEPRDLRTATAASPDARIVGEGAAPEDEEHAFEVRSRIRVALGEDVTVDAVGLSGRLEGSLTTRSGYRDVETGRGEIRVVDGKYEAYGQKLDIVRGRLLFDGSPLADPGLDIQAEEELPEVTVGLNVRGTLRAPRLSLYSDPQMPQSQILSYLLIGKPIDEAGSQEAATVGSATDRLAVSGGGFLASRIGRELGLEEVGIESDGAEDTALVLGKFLSPRVFVSYGISLTESINTVKMRYTISDSWVLKIEAGEQQSADLEFKIER